MKVMRGSTCFAILAGMVLVLCCISTSAYASSDDEPIGINPPWPQDEPWYQPFIIVIGEWDGTLEYILPPDREILPYPRRFNGVPPIDIDVSLFDFYNISNNSYGIAPGNLPS